MRFDMGKLHGKLIRERRKAKKLIQKEKQSKGKLPVVRKTSKQIEVKATKVGNIRERKGIRCIQPDEAMKVPKCPHGPCLLFTDGIENWFSCSIYRANELCNYRVTITEGGTHDFEDALQIVYTYGLGNSRRTFEETKNKNELNWCVRCFAYVSLPHQHPVEKLLKSGDLNLIGKLLKAPKAKNDGEAQYWFTGEVLRVLTENLKTFDSILCIGCPTVAEFMRKAGKKIFVLDYDHRLSNFFDPTQFAHYNMLSNYFYEADGVDWTTKFFKNAFRTALVCDPPFGVQFEPLARSLKKIEDLHAELNPCGEFTKFLFSPVFMKRFMNGYRMLDFKVTYVNHRQFSEKRKTIVRIFTDMKDLKTFKLQDGYRLCKKCSRYVSDENEHCKKCNECATELGPTYRHCDMCGKCVKPSYKHCITCLRCHLPNRCIK
ncbi:unnamed protein product [Bursaphelenchus okinawaensis]|uniref:CTCHY-type domain-containing protein n=1 Tax=Bursaphelenchus okinawaensis TaxID=465554 RepID=A0A811JZH4_9BILA|nr:unnamed protein product [Bursaphelenchus okinawaensis]CAG9088236.1 unnamed protein product [Bursaphelenchus okinawaensis]